MNMLDQQKKMATVIVGGMATAKPPSDYSTAMESAAGKFLSAKEPKALAAAFKELFDLCSMQDEPEDASGE